MKLKSGIYGFFLTLVILLTAFWVADLYPFGWGTVSWCDMNQQLIPLFCDFKDILSGKESLFLNFANGGGMNFYGVFFFFLSSPFTFGVALVDKADIPFLMNILVILKLSLSGFTASYTFSAINKKAGAGAAAALGSAYALCGYGMLFYQNIMWLDQMYLFPVIALGICKLLRENRSALLAVALTLSVVFNFYISFMVYLFVIFFFGIYACVYPNADRKIYVNLSLCGLLSLVASAVVWLPCLLQYLGSARTNSFLEELKNSGFFAPYETTMTVLLCSGLIFAGLLVTLPKITLQSKRVKLLTAVFLLTSVPLLIEPVNLMWHTGSYMSFPARYGFIPVFAGLLLTLEKISQAAERKSKGLTALAIVAVTLLSCFAILFTGKNSKELSAYINSLWGNEKSLKGQILICLVFTVCYLLCVILFKKGRLKKQIFAMLLCLTVFAEGLCSANIFISNAKDKLSVYNYQSMINLESKADNESFYRVNTVRKITDANMTGGAGFNSLSHYTSLNDQLFMETAKKLGYSGYWMETGNWGGSILSDALLSVGYTASRTNGEYSLEENPYYLGLGIKAEGEIPKALKTKDRLFALGKAFAKMSNIPNPVTKYEPEDVIDATLKEKGDNYSIVNKSEVGTIRYNIAVEGNKTLYFDCYNGFSNRLVEDINRSISVYANGEIVSESYPTQTENGLLKLGSFENAEVNITIKTLEDIECISFGVFGVDETALKNYTDSAETLNLKEKSGTVKGAAKKGSYFISLPYKDNYRITLNGEKLSYSKALDGFIAVDIPYDGQLKITFTPKGFYVGLAITLSGIFAMALFIVLSRKEVLYNELTKNILYGAFLGGFCASALLVYIIPIIVNLSDFKI